MSPPRNLWVKAATGSCSKRAAARERLSASFDAFARSRTTALPWYDSQTGHGIERFLRAPMASTLVHVDGDPSGRATLLVLDTGGG